MKCSINSIFKSTEGEGIRIGIPQIFVRFQGCHVGCLNCDTKETWEFSEQYLWPLEKVIEKIHSLSIKGIKGKQWVSITGGDPLHPSLEPQVRALIVELKKEGYALNIEASGTRLVPDIFEQVDFISFDCKTPSTGVKTQEKLLQQFILNYPFKSQIKSVIADERDFDFVHSLYTRLIQELNLGENLLSQISQTPWCLTPCYNTGEKFSAEKFIKILKLNESYGNIFRVIGQQHKWIYGPDKSEV